MQKSMSPKAEPASEPLHIYVKKLFRSAVCTGYGDARAGARGGKCHRFRSPPCGNRARHKSIVAASLYWIFVWRVTLVPAETVVGRALRIKILGSSFYRPLKGPGMVDRLR